MEQYGVKAFGQYIYEKGAGGTTEEQDYYFFIDSSYISIVIKYGLIFLIIICAILVKEVYEFQNKKKFIWISMLFVICIQSIMEHHMIQYWYNPFVIVAFSFINSENMNSKIPVRGKMQLHVEELD